MKRIIEEVFAAEEKVGAILKQAQSQASEIRQSADREIAESISRAKEEARQIIQASVEQAKKDAEQIRKERLQEAERAREALLASRAANLDGLVETLCHVIRTTQYDTDTP